MPITPQLPSSTAVKDFLSTQGKDTSFSSIKNLFSSFGLDGRLGSYVGSPNQNQTLLKSLQTSVPKTTTPFYPTPTGAPIQSTTPATNATKVIYDTSKLKPGTNTAVTDILKSNTGGMTKVPATPPASTTPATAGMTTSKALSTIGVNNTQPVTTVTPTKTNEEYIQNITDINPELGNRIMDVLGYSKGTPITQAFGNDVTVPEADLIDQYLSSAEGQNLLSDAQNNNLSETAKTDAAKAALETKYSADKTTLEDKLAANGLAFSGIRGSQVKVLADSLASSLLGEDRALASKLLDSDAKLRDSILKGVADLAKAAQDGRKEAIQQLNAIGYAVVNGTLVPTLAAQSAARADAAAVRSEQANARAERYLQMAEERAIKEGANAAKKTVEERKAEAVSNYSSKFVFGATLPDGTPILDSDGYITPEAWNAAIKDAPAYGLTRADFIKEFGYLIYTGGQVSSKYNLTPAELKTVTGALPE